MDLNLIKKLIKIVEQSEITDFSVQEGDLKVRISKNLNHIPQVSFQPVNELPKTVSIQQATSIQNAAGETVASVPAKIESNLHEIKSPIVGTFYRAPAPDADPYVQVGDTVSAGNVLCIVEAMKLMNEIESDISGKIVKILVENASPVEYNQPLFLIETV
jgi:acetyl-CoA carboxylase biotin carboxyl carrier protein